MKQPKIVRILDCSEKRLFNLPDIEFICRLQKRDVGDNSKLVYISNPWHNPDSDSPLNAENKYLVFTESEYEVVEWTNK